MTAKKETTASLIKKLEAKIDQLDKKLDLVLANQSVIYNRNLITRKNMLQLYNGEEPSMTENEKKELDEVRHPPITPKVAKKRKVH